MNDRHQPHQVKVAKDLQDLIPAFMANRRKEADALRAALAADNFEQLRQLGHRMRGVGNSYGFALISVFGKRIEEGVSARDRAALDACIAEYGDYLSKVQISYE